MKFLLAKSGLNCIIKRNITGEMLNSYEIMKEVLGWNLSGLIVSASFTL